MQNLLKQPETERKVERHLQINKSSIFEAILKLVLQNKIEQKRNSDEHLFWLFIT